MIVRSYGFSLEAGHKLVSIADLFHHMAAHSGEADNTKTSERRFYIDEAGDADFIRGLVVTVKDQKAFCELVEGRGGKFVISVKNLEGENKLMEFNFFVVNKNNGLGIYQHYFQSCSPNTFGDYLRKRYFNLSQALLNAEIEKAKVAGKHTQKVERALRAKYRQSLGFSILVHNEKLSDVLDKFQQIKSFEYEFSAVVPDMVKGIPIGPYVKRMKEKVIFQPKAAVSALAKAIQGTVDKIKPKSGRISVIDHIDDEDVPLSVRIADIPEHFGEQDYSVVAAKLDQLDVDTFSQHQVIKELTSTCKGDYKHIFMKKVK